VPHNKSASQLFSKTVHYALAVDDNPPFKGTRLLPDHIIAPEQRRPRRNSEKSCHVTTITSPVITVTAP